ncbi:hypothetical protein D3C72_544310 [compost metagenome]
MSGQATQRPGIGEQRLRPTVERRPLAQVGDIGKCPARARRFDASGIVLAKALDHPQTHANRRLHRRGGFQAAIPVTGAHVDRADLQLMPARILENLVRTVETHWPAIDQRAGERRRFVALEPATGVSQQGKTGGVGLGKTVAAEAFDLFENLRGELRRVAVLLHAGGEAFLVRFQSAVAFPRSHRATQLISLAGAVIGGDDGDLHHLFLKQRHAEGSFQNNLELW